jgi:hypothetical protein
MLLPLPLPSVTVKVLLLFLICSDVAAFPAGGTKPTNTFTRRIRARPSSSALTRRAGNALTPIETISTSNDDGDGAIAESKLESLDAMRARAGVLRRTMLKQQLELQNLERQIVYSQEQQRGLSSFMETLVDKTASSTAVLFRKLSRVQKQTGKNNQKWQGKVEDFVVAQTVTGVRILGTLLQNPEQWKFFIDPETPTLVTHVPAILARLDQLEDQTLLGRNPRAVRRH